MRLQLAENIEALRKGLGWSQETLASRAGMTRGSIGNYVNGRTIPNVVDAWRLADALGVTLDELVGRAPLPGGEGTPRQRSLADYARTAGMTMEQLLEELVTALAAERARTKGAAPDGPSA